MEQPPQSTPERRLASPESRTKFETFRDLINGRRCKVAELRASRKDKSITEEQYALLVTLLAEKLEEAVETDPLTGVLDRAILEPEIDRLKEQLNKEGEENKGLESVVTIFLDIKDFKKLNDNYGHDVGDKALVLVAESLSKATKKKDMVFRVGGDEFIVLLPNTDKRQNNQSIEAIFNRIKTNVNNVLLSNNVPFSISMGYSVLNKGDNRGAAQLIKEADTAMYKDKKSSKGEVMSQIAA